MKKQYKFAAVLEETDGGGVFVAFPYDVKKEFGVAGRVPIKATIDGEKYTGSLVKYATPFHFLLVLKSIREKIQKKPGDTVNIVLERDTSVRTVEIPTAFKTLLQKNKLLSFFEKMSYTHQKEWVKWITEAKKTPTKERRILQAIEQLKAKKG